MHSPSSGARAQEVLAQPRRWWGAGNTWMAWPYQHRGKARPWCRRRLEGSRGGGGAECPRPHPQPRPRGPRTMGKRILWQAARGPKP